MKQLFLIAGLLGLAVSALAQNTFPGNGKVGVGTADPRAKLTVRGISQNETDSAGLRLVNDWSAHGNFFISSFVNQNSSDNNLRIGENGDTFMTLISDSPQGGLVRGSVGIGTIAPRALLEVNGSAIISGPGNTLTLEKPTNHIPALTFKGATGYSLIEAGDDYMTMYAGGSRRMTVLANGNVLVGKTSQSNATYKLDIAGKVRADEIVVNTTGADFVFQDGYKVRNLEELERFILANKHLPDIPPAKTMQEEGVGVSELQTRLLQKIEELTLYVIELKKEINDLKSKK